MKIVVLAGGLSTERQVALTSGTGVCKALRQRGHKAILVDMFLGLESYDGALEDIFDAPDGLCGQSRVESVEPDLEAVRRSRRDQSPSLLGQDVLTVCRMADVVFLALHGSCGEDGRIQATLDLLGVPYTGSGYLGSGMAMDKSVTKRMMDSGGALRREDRQRRQLLGRGAAGHEGAAGKGAARPAALRRPCGGGEKDQGS